MIFINRKLLVEGKVLILDQAINRPFKTYLKEMSVQEKLIRI